MVNLRALRTGILEVVRSSAQVMTIAFDVRSLSILLIFPIHS